jgi:hypothetical protein
MELLTGTGRRPSAPLVSSPTMKDLDRSAQARQSGDLIRSTKILPKRSLSERRSGEEFSCSLHSALGHLKNVTLSVVCSSALG